MAPHQQSPSGRALRGIRNLLGMGARVYRLELAQIRWFRGDRNRNALIVLDIGELLAGPEDQEEEVEALVRIADDRRLRPTVRPYGGDRHDPVGVENPDRRLFHQDLQEGLFRLADL